MNDLSRPPVASTAGAASPLPAPVATSHRPAGDRGRRRAINPDLSGLARGPASVVESLASAAGITLLHRIVAAKDLLAKARPGSRRHTDIRGELQMWERQFADAQAFEAAARRRRMRPLTADEHALLAAAREQAPDISGREIEALLLAVPTDKLEIAGLRLDSARAEMTRLCSAPGTVDEDAFGRAEEALDTARAEYRRLIAEQTGQDADVVERRMSA